MEEDESDFVGCGGAEDCPAGHFCHLHPGVPDCAKLCTH
jgi:hypothetical protein